MNCAVCLLRQDHADKKIAKAVSLMEEMRATLSNLPSAKVSPVLDHVLSSLHNAAIAIRSVTTLPEQPVQLPKQTIMGRTGTLEKQPEDE